MRTEGGDTTSKTEMPVVSTATTKAKARSITDAAGARDCILDILNMIDQVQSKDPDPMRMRVNGAKNKTRKKWNGG